MSTLHTARNSLSGPLLRVQLERGPGQQQGSGRIGGGGRGACTPFCPELGGVAGPPSGHLSLGQVNYCTMLLSSVADTLAQGGVPPSKCVSGEGWVRGGTWDRTLSPAFLSEGPCWATASQAGGYGLEDP